MTDQEKRDVVAVGQTDTLTALLARMPEEARRRALRPPTASERDRRRLQHAIESPAEREERILAGQAVRRAQWERRCPPEFYQARLDTLYATQHPGTLRLWLERSDTRTLVLWSTQNGNGKSTAAYAVGWAAVERGMWALAWTMPELNNALRPGGDPDVWDAAVGCDLLVIDDLGKERETEWTLEQLHMLIDARWRDGKRTVVDTNLPGDQVVARYGSAIASRLSDDAKIIEFTGPSRRAVAPW